MSPRIVRARPRTHDRTADAVQHILELGGGLSAAAREELMELFSTYAPQPWVFVMISRENSRRIQRRINEECERPAATLAVWHAALTYTEIGDPLVKATRKQLAEQADVSVSDVSRAYGALVAIGAMIKVDGGYELHPDIAWRGSLAAREAALQEIARRGGARLELVESDKA